MYRKWHSLGKLCLILIYLENSIFIFSVIFCPDTSLSCRSLCKVTENIMAIFFGKCTFSAIRVQYRKNEICPGTQQLSNNCQCDVWLAAYWSFPFTVVLSCHLSQGFIHACHFSSIRLMYGNFKWQQHLLQRRFLAFFAMMSTTVTQCILDISFTLLSLTVLIIEIAWLALFKQGWALFC